MYSGIDSRAKILHEFPTLIHVKIRSIVNIRIYMDSQEIFQKFYEIE